MTFRNQNSPPDLGSEKVTSSFLNSFKTHFPVFLLLLVLVFASFGRLLSTPLWHSSDFYVLTEAHLLLQNPWPMFHHIGFYFSQPVLQIAFLVEYYFFGINPAGYIAVNLVIHTIISFLVYMLVNLLFP